MIKTIISGILAIFISLPAMACFEESHPIISILNQRLTNRIYKLWIEQGKLDFEFNAGLLYCEAQDAAINIIYDNFVCKEFYGEES